MSQEIKIYIKLMLWAVALTVAGMIMGALAKGGVDTWYKTLNLSPLTPPDYVFGIVWSALNIMIAAAGWLIWEAKDSQLKILYALQLVLHWSWTPLFFCYHLIGVSLLCSILIMALVGVLIIRSYRKLTAVSLLLLPYFLWLLFANYLTFYTWQYN